jgi:hypothetical protein
VIDRKTAFIGRYFCEPGREVTRAAASHGESWGE